MVVALSLYVLSLSFSFSLFPSIAYIFALFMIVYLLVVGCNLFFFLGGVNLFNFVLLFREILFHVNLPLEMVAPLS